MSSILQTPQTVTTAAIPLPASPVNLADARIRGQWRPSAEQIADWSLDARIVHMFAEIGTPGTVARNGELYAEDDAVDNLYRIESGVIRTCKILNDGRRQIDGFYMAGDIVGLEFGRRHLYCAEAVSRATFRVVRMRTVHAQIETGGDMSCALWEMTARELYRSQQHILLLGRRSAQERVGCFLLAMANRIVGKDVLDTAGAAFDLPMSRQDMADYLGLTIETVSRTFTQLEGLGVIALVSARKVRLCNRAALRDMHG